jgi:hypothetical protein
MAATIVLTFVEGVGIIWRKLDRCRHDALFQALLLHPPRDGNNPLLGQECTCSQYFANPQYIERSFLSNIQLTRAVQKLLYKNGHLHLPGWVNNGWYTYCINKEYCFGRVHACPPTAGRQSNKSGTCPAHF